MKKPAVLLKYNNSIICNRDGYKNFEDADKDRDNYCAYNDLGGIEIVLVNNRYYVVYGDSYYNGYPPPYV